jgi:hypothetical protein
VAALAVDHVGIVAESIVGIDRLLLGCGDEIACIEETVFC